MARKSADVAKCPICGGKDVSEPRGEARYCRVCWDKKIAVEEIVAREFTLKRFIRAQNAEKQFLFHSTQRAPIAQIQVIDDGYDLFMTAVLYPTFGWDDQAYHLDNDPEFRTFNHILVDILVSDIVEPWGGGKWHLEVFRAAGPEPEAWNGEI
jgi:hypothetical protein